MNLPIHKRRRGGKVSVWAASIVAILLAAAGCGSNQPTAVKPPSVDGETASASVIDQYDESGDGLLDSTELANCPPLALVVAKYDADGNSQLSPQEISDRVASLYATGNSLLAFDCTVTLDGRALSEATVRLRPATFLGDSVRPAQGITDASGVARPSIAAEELPADLQGSRLIHPGLYHVEITHPRQTLPDRYNSQTELCVEVDPLSREGYAARFDLKL